MKIPVFLDMTLYHWATGLPRGKNRSTFIFRVKSSTLKFLRNVGTSSPNNTA